VLNWNGGTGPFSIQENTNLDTTVWSNIATTTNFNLTVTNGASQAFFRIVDTGQTVH
jgi:hypothetical protein